MEEKLSSPSAFQEEASGDLKQAMKNARGISSASQEPPNSSVSISILPSGGPSEGESIDYQQRGQWLRAAVLGANDGLVTTASLMMGVGAVKSDAKTMVMSGLAALVAGACSMAIGEFVSVQTQRDVELSNLKRKKKALTLKISCDGLEPPTLVKSPRSPIILRRPGSPFVVPGAELESLPSPIQAACASGVAFSAGALLPLISTAFIGEYVMRVCVLAGVSSLALIMFGAVGAYFGRSSMVRGSVRVLIGGWIAMLVTYGLLRLFRATAGV